MSIFTWPDLSAGRDETSPERPSERPAWPAVGRPRSNFGKFGKFDLRRSGKAHGFTLVELLVSTAIIALIMLMLVQVTNNISAAWRGTAEKVDKFQGARDGFEAMTRRISQATLNTYWDYYDISGVARSQWVQSKTLLISCRLPMDGNPTCGSFAGRCRAFRGVLRTIPHYPALLS
jgi:prepilin-type N-terminal cleavage/methylation domain-containing protein